MNAVVAIPAFVTAATRPGSRIHDDARCMVLAARISHWLRPMRAAHPRRAAPLSPFAPSSEDASAEIALPPYLGEAATLPNPVACLIGRFFLRLPTPVIAVLAGCGLVTSGGRRGRARRI